MSPLSYFPFKQFTVNPSTRQEIHLATAAREPQPDYRSRMNNDLMLVIEDQWRKQLHEEQRQEEEDRRKEEAARVEGIVAKEARRSSQGMGEDVNQGDVDVELERIEGRRSRQEVTVERVGTGAERGARDGRSSGQEVVLDE